MSNYNKPKLVKKILELRAHLDEVYEKPCRWQVWKVMCVPVSQSILTCFLTRQCTIAPKIHREIDVSPTEKLALVYLSDAFNTIPGILPLYSTSGQNKGLKLNEGMDITSKATMLKLHLMVPEGKIGVYVHVHDYFIAMDGGSLKPGLTSVNQEQDIRNWLHEKEKQLRTTAGSLEPIPFPTLDQIRRSLAQDNDSSSDTGDHEMEVTDDADVLLDIGNDDDDDTIGDSEQESSAHQIKRTKLTSEGPMSQGTSYPSSKFGWDSSDYVTDVECIIPKDQQRLLNNLPGWTSSHENGSLEKPSLEETPLITASSTLASHEMVTQEENLQETESLADTTKRFSISFFKNGLTEVPCEVECQASLDSEDNKDVDMDRYVSLQAMIKQILLQRDELYKSFIPMNSFTVL